MARRSNWLFPSRFTSSKTIRHNGDGSKTVTQRITDHGLFGNTTNVYTYKQQSSSATEVLMALIALPVFLVLLAAVPVYVVVLVVFLLWAGFETVLVGLIYLLSFGKLRMKLRRCIGIRLTRWLLAIS
jgi:hypothetical protein